MHRTQLLPEAGKWPALLENLPQAASFSPPTEVDGYKGTMSPSGTQNRPTEFVILNEVKDLLAHPSKQILRFAQNDKLTANFLSQRDIVHS